MEAYLAKSCKHGMNSSFCNQVNCLKLANCSEHFLKEVAKTLVSKMKEKPEKAHVSRKKTKPVGYIQNQKLSHNHSTSSSARVFSTPSLTLRLMLKNQQQNKEDDVCKEKHCEQYIKCATSVVYEIPTRNGNAHVGQKGTCVNNRAREHESSVHCDGCPCAPGS